MKYFNFLIFIIFIFTNFISASALIGPNDEIKIKKIEIYLNQNYTNTDTTTYPLTKGMLNKTFSNKSNDLDHILYRQKVNSVFLNEPTHREIKLNAFSEILPVRNIDDAWNGKNSLSYQISYQGNNLTYQFKISSYENRANKTDYHFDESYIAYTNWNLVFGFGSLNRWWGPTHNNNLILSNFARPSPGVFVQSLSGFEFDGLLSFIGKTNFSLFVNRLESNRAVPNPYLVGSRMTFIPYNNLQIGFTRTMMIGGENRKENGDILIKAFFGAFEGADNIVGSGGRTDLNSFEHDPSNQIAAIDIKYDFLFKNNLISFYVQQGADDGGPEWHQPLSHHTHTIGTEIKFESDKGLLSAYIFEVSKTDAVWHEVAGTRYNVTYEHGVYQSGHRYRGLPIAAFIDNDSIYSQFSFIKEINVKDSFKIDLFYADLNKDGTGKSVWGNSANVIKGVKTKFNKTINKNLSIELNLLLTDRKLEFTNKLIDKNVFGASLIYEL